MSATRAGASTFWRTFRNPPGGTRIQSEDWKDQASYYDHLWAMYANTKFENLAQWSHYKARHGLGRHIRMIYNPARRLCDFYAGIIYPGVLSEDGANLPRHTLLAIPLADDTAPEIRAGLGQLWQWSNWQAGKTIMGQRGAMLGNAFIEWVDDLERGHIRAEHIWPGHIVDMDRDAVGNVKTYSYRYETHDEDGTAWDYTRRVDGEWIREWRDEELISEEPNPYGFAPAVWAPHFETGEIYGAPAIRNISKMDELNHLAALLSDKLALDLDAPLIIWGGGNAAPALDVAGKNQPSGQRPNAQQDRERRKILQGPAGGAIDSIAIEGVDQALLWINAIIKEIEDDHPELTMYKELRAMSQITGPAAERLLGDAGSLIGQARDNYDVHTRKLFQMGLAIGGYRANGGGWGRSLSRQQEKFRPFDLDSYDQGDLNFDILPRPIIPETPLETIQRERLERSADRDRDAPPPGEGEIESRIRMMGREDGLGA